MGFIDKLLRRRPAAPALAGERSIGSALREHFGYMQLPKSAHQLTKSYGQRPWLHAVVSRRADAFANVPWCLFRARTPDTDVRAVLRAYNVDHMWRTGAQPTRAKAIQALVAAGRLEQVHDHKIIDLLEQPGKGLPGRMLMELISTWLDLSGEAFIGIERNMRGRPIELVAVAPTFVERIATRERPTYGVRTIKGTIDVPEADIIWIRKMDPADPYGGRGVGTAGSLSDELDTDEAASKAAKSRFYNRSVPDLIIGMEGMSTEELARLEQEFDDSNRGPMRSGRVHFLGDKFQAVPMTQTAVESQHVQMRQFIRDAVIQGYGTPPEIVGVLQNSNKSTIAASKAHFAEFSTVPKLDRVQAMLQQTLVPPFGKNYLLGYVSPMPEDRETKEKLMVALPHAFRKDEVRAFAGEPPLPNGEGQQMMPSHGGAPPIPIAGDVPQDVVEDIPETTDDDDDELDDDARNLRVILGSALQGIQ